MMTYVEPCPYCGKLMDSMDSVADTRMLVRSHIDQSHPDEDSDEL